MRNLKLRNNINRITDNHVYVIADRIKFLLDIVDLDNIHHIVDVGCAHGYESYNLARLFPYAEVWGFEPAPDHYQFCLQHYSNLPLELRSRIHISELALDNQDGEISFYPLDPEKAHSINTGIASKFKLIDPAVFPHEYNAQKEIKVQATRFDNWWNANTSISNGPDLVWMDAQGAELDILHGFGDLLINTKAILTEVGLKPYYQDQTLKVSIDAYLKSIGFDELYSGFIQRHEYEADTIYVNFRFTG